MAWHTLITSLVALTALFQLSQASYQPTLIKPGSWLDAAPESSLVNGLRQQQEALYRHIEALGRRFSSTPDAVVSTVGLKSRSVRFETHPTVTRIDESLQSRLDRSKASRVESASGTPATLPVSVLVQFREPLTDKQRALLAQITTSWFVVPPSTVHVLCPYDQLGALTSMDGVAWAGHHRPLDKFAESVWSHEPSPLLRTQSMAFAVEMHPGVDARAVQSVLASMVAVDGITFHTVTSSRLSMHVSVEVTEDQLRRAMGMVAGEEAVVWIEPQHDVAHITNSAAGAIVQGGAPLGQLTTKIHDMGIQGQSQLIGVGDTGIDWHNCLFFDPVTPPNPCGGTCHLSDMMSAACYQQFLTDPKNTNCPQLPITCNFAGADCQPSSSRKVALYWGWVDNNDAMDGHGTHVCGSVAGKAAYSGTAPPIENYHGMAPEARLVFADLGLAAVPEATVAPPGLFQNYFPYFYNAGARVVSNSWGSVACPTANCGNYALNSFDTDRFVEANPDMVILFAAANNGQSGFFTLSNEAHNKNGITVGASRSTYNHLVADVPPYQANSVYNQLMATVNTDTFWQTSVGNGHTICDAFVIRASMGTCDAVKAYFRGKFMSPSYCCAVGSSLAIADQLWAQALPSCCVTSITAGFQTEGNEGIADQSTIAPFSSRGPTADGRLKPDIVAPGDVVVSARSHGQTEVNQCSTDPNASDSALLAMSGTSMATPITAGAVALVQQYFKGGFYPNGPSFSPSAALVKATLINSAVPLMMHAFQDGVSKTILLMKPELGYQFAQGHGRVQLDHALEFQGDETSPVLIVNDELTSRVTVGQPMWFDYDVAQNVDGGSSLPGLAVTVAWTDAPASPAAAHQLVNDLDLTVYLPDCSAVHGNEYLQLAMLADPAQAQWSNGLLPQYAPVHGQPVDRVNNAERVLVPLATFQPGRYRVQVSAYMLNSPGNVDGSQSFAMAVNFGARTTLADPLVCPGFEYANTTTGLLDYVIHAKVSTAVTAQNAQQMLTYLANLLDVDVNERLWFYNLSTDALNNNWFTFSIADVPGGPSVAYQDRGQFTGGYLMQLFMVLWANQQSSLYTGAQPLLASFDPTVQPSYQTIAHVDRTPASASNTDLIVGVVVAGVALLIIVGVAVWCCRKRRQSAQPTTSTYVQGGHTDVGYTQLADESGRGKGRIQ